ncbi:MAG: VWA domain-containing protein [Burkholderiales bacterium]|uniref:VWA domain-containing protein n=1 Tax=Roseateles sp. TaxID=1971397 RepID=UPI000FA00C4F|nr:MAG: VWA domain-containing protein [Burkholderiales bacterium]
MGHGNYSHAAHAALLADRASLSAEEVFRQTGCHPLMNPRGLTVRESRDSADHPRALPIAFALDVTGSMGDIPRALAQRDLPQFMRLLQACAIEDPQVLFMAIGDATSDNAPLQVGQFESTAELIDQWLTWSYLEGGGGGTGSESYELAFYLLARHTDTDSWVQRRHRGYMFMTGDELPYPAVSRHQVGTLLGDQLDEDIPVEEAIAAAAEQYHLFFLIPDLQRRQRCEDRWRDLLGDHVICMESPDDTCYVAAALVGLTEGRLPDLDAAARALASQGLARDRVSAVVRALRPYAALLRPGTVGLPLRPGARPAAAPATGGWWKRLLG